MIFRLSKKKPVMINCCCANLRLRTWLKYTYLLPVSLRKSNVKYTALLSKRTKSRNNLNKSPFQSESIFIISFVFHGRTSKLNVFLNELIGKMFRGKRYEDIVSKFNIYDKNAITLPSKEMNGSSSASSNPSLTVSKPKLQRALSYFLWIEESFL